MEALLVPFALQLSEARSYGPVPGATQELDYLFTFLNMGIGAVIGTAFVFHIHHRRYGALSSASWRSAHPLW